MQRHNNNQAYPSLAELEQELSRVQYGKRYRAVVRSTVFVLVSVAAVAVLVSVLVIPVLRIYGTSMEPTLHEGDIIVALKGAQFETGDLVAFYYNNKILTKRVIANSGDWVNIDEDGTVSVNDVKLDEPYLRDKELGQCDLKLPYQVPDGRYFVLGDHRSTSVDSRSNLVGCVAEEQVVGKLAVRVWPLQRFGFL